MNAQDLKNSILHLAIQGKLVEQREEEGSAKDLLNQIRAEKERLIKEKKIKKEKPLPVITDDEIPFDIPESWEWVRFRDVCAVLTCGYASTPTYVNEENGMPFISAKNVKPYRFMPEEHNYISKELYCKLTKTCNPEKGDILLTRVGAGIGEAAIIDSDLLFAIYVSLTLIKLVDYSLLDNRYVLYWLNSPIGVASSIKNIFGKNASQGNLNVENVRSFLFPIPPLHEQKRIVAKIEELMPFIDKYGESYLKLETLNKKFPEDMQKSILQYAIQGKLVEQRTEEGTAEELYQQIQAEKARLVKEGKIKKEKPLPEITEDEISFEIPESWKWVRLENIVYNRGQTKPDNIFAYIDIGSINNKEQKLNDCDNIIDPTNAPSRARKIVEFGDILYSTVRPYLHNMCIIDRQFSCKPIASTGFAVMTCCNGLNNKYLFNYLMSPSFDSYANSNENSKGVAYPAINDDRLYRAIVPLPPLNEQRRIVEKIEELLPYCKRLTK